MQGRHFLQHCSVGFFPFPKEMEFARPAAFRVRQIPGIQKLGIRKHSARSRCFRASVNTFRPV